MLRHICKANGCTRLSVDGHKYCAEHIAQEAKERERQEAKSYKPIEATHGINSEMYHSYKWRCIRQNQLKEHPLCEKCGAEATDVHHHIPPKGDPSLFFDKGNLVSLCKACHWKITQEEMAEEKRLKAVAKRKLWY